MGGVAENVDDPDGMRRAEHCMLRRFPQLAEWAKSGQGWADVVFLKIKPQVISVLDYEKGFGHTELVRVQAHATHHGPVVELGGSGIKGATKSTSFAVISSAR